MKRHFLTLLAALLLAPPAELHAADFVLVAKDTPPAPIIVFKDAPPRTRDAAVTLADYIEKMSGQRPVVLDGEPSPPPPRAIWVGVQPAARALFPKIDFDFQYAEETLIVANENNLVIAGRDRWNPSQREAKGRLAMRTGIQQEYGTANAVYSLLQEQLGVRWLWPGEEDVVKRERIALAPCEVRYHPTIRSRGGMFVKSSLGDSKENGDELWARFQRVQLDSMDLSGGHGFGDWWEKYGKDHPDYFAAAPDGTRKAVASNPRNTKLCEANPAVWKQWLDDTTELVKTNPLLRVINVSPNDGYTSAHCTCSNCLAWDHPKGETMEWTFGGGVKFQGVSQTDRDVRFANTLARMLKERFPDRELFVQLNAYGLARNPPLGIAPDDNVIISSVANFHLRSPAERERPMQQHAGWAAKAKHLMWRPNLGSPAGLSWGMPDVAMTQAGEDFRFVADKHCLGLFFDLFWLHWATQGPHYYVLAHLAWNPRADVAAVMDDYYQRGFGPASADVKAYWQLLERTRMEFVAEEPSRHRAFDLPKKYTPELFAKAQAHLDAAASRLKDADEKYHRRLHFVRCGLDYAKLVVETRAGMQKVEASKGKDEEAKAKVLARWERIGQMKKDFPEFAINWQAVFRPPTGAEEAGKRVMGLHPDAPLSGRTLRELRTPGLE
ncbi:MAG: DUF4838 domain-containing protein [Lentisphaerae bacterium]|nr:DUF4838 domain-containing protein [Lentisphaerota bacterium]